MSLENLHPIIHSHKIYCSHVKILEEASWWCELFHDMLQQINRSRNFQQFWSVIDCCWEMHISWNMITFNPCLFAVLQVCIHPSLASSWLCNWFLKLLQKANPLLEEHNSSSSLGITFLHWGLWAFIDHFKSLHQVDFMSCNAPALRHYPTRNTFVEGRFRKTSHANLMQEITPEDPQIMKAILAKVVSCYIKKTV